MAFQLLISKLFFGLKFEIFSVNENTDIHLFNTILSQGGGLPY